MCVRARVCVRDVPEYFKKFLVILVPHRILGITHTHTHARTHARTHFLYKCRLLITLVNSLGPDQVKSADDKKHRKYPSMQGVKSTGHEFDWKIEHV